jgi:hypothetical protein
MIIGGEHSQGEVEGAIVLLAGYLGPDIMCQNYIDKFDLAISFGIECDSELQPNFQFYTELLLEATWSLWLMIQDDSVRKLMKLPNMLQEHVC